MGQNTLIVSNWKMNFNFIQAKNLVTNLKNIEYNKKKISNVICPQFLLLPILDKLLEESDFVLGAQDFHFEFSGAYTGDTSIELVKDYNCKYSIIGHSERRILHNESNSMIKKKLDCVWITLLFQFYVLGSQLNKEKKIFIKNS